MKYANRVDVIATKPDGSEMRFFLRETSLARDILDKLSLDCSHSVLHGGQELPLDGQIGKAAVGDILTLRVQVRKGGLTWPRVKFPIWG